MSTPAKVTADLTSKIASLLAAEKGTFTVSGSLPIASDRESAASSQPTQCSPITVRWDPASAPAGESRNMIFPPAPAAESTGRGLDQLEALLRACQPATFGRGGEDILDETYRKALKLDSSVFSSDLCPYELGIVGTVAELLMPSKYMAGGTRGVKAELYKLNVSLAHLLSMSVNSDDILDLLRPIGALQSPRRHPAFRVPVWVSSHMPPLCTLRRRPFRAP